MILSAIKTSDAAELRVAKHGQIRRVAYRSIEDAQRALSAIEREVMQRCPGARAVTQMDNDGMTVVIEGLPVEPERKAKRRSALAPPNDPKAFNRWRLGVIRRAVEAINEEAGETEPAELEL
jgi:hypothetical protein